MGCPSKELMEGMSVNVDDPTGADTHSHAFAGTIVSVQEDAVVVKDQDGSEFSVGKARVHPVDAD